MYTKVCVYFIHSCCFGASEGRAGRQLQCSDLQALGLAFRAEALDVAFANGKLGETFYTSITYNIYIYIYIHMYNTYACMYVCMHACMYVCISHIMFYDDISTYCECVLHLQSIYR